jgi:3-oxoacyl-ACP reductase-like protein
LRGNGSFEIFDRDNHHALHMRLRARGVIIMGIFESIKNAIFKHPAAAAPASADAAPASTSAAATPAAAPSAAAPQSVDVGAVLTAMETKSGQKLNWQSSIVDLMKLVGLDSSLQNRKQLATELGYKGDQNDSATMNIWLHKQVISQLEANGGKLPASMKAA